jgi:Trk K+ transport system NAD-binding subunit
VIVCGLGALGLRVVEVLHGSSAPVRVIDDEPDPKALPQLERRGVDFVRDNPRLPEALQQAGLTQARAVVSVQSDDLRNLETALVVRSLRRDVRIIVQMANLAVGEALQDLVGAGAALDVAALAAPSLAQACLGGTAHLQLDIAGEVFGVTETTVTRPGTLRSIYGDLVPIGVAAVDASVEICPGRDHPVRPGDKVTVLGTPADLAEALGGRRATMVAGTSQPSRVATVIHAVTSVAEGAGRRIGALLLALVGLVAVSAILLRLSYRTGSGHHPSTLNSVYFTVETISTVGFGDYSFATQSPWLRVYGIVLIVLGVTAITALFAFITDLLLSRRVADAFGLRRVTRMRGHVVVVGLGAVGLRVVEELIRYGRSVVVIENDEQNRHLPLARGLKVPVVIGDATGGTAVSDANVAAASAVAVLTSDDLTNLETGLSLRQYLHDAGVEMPITMRIFDRSLARVIQQSFDFGLVRSTSALAAPWFVGAALGLDILSTFYVEQELLLLARLTVARSGGLAGLAMQDLSARTRVVAIRRSGESGLEHPPRRTTRFGSGDQAYLVGPYDELIAVLRRDADQNRTQPEPEHQTPEQDQSRPSTRGTANGDVSSTIHATPIEPKRERPRVEAVRSPERPEED